MHAIAVIESFVMRNPATGAVCSPYGAIPPGYTETVKRGWTIQLDNGQVGIGRAPCATKAEAETLANSMNIRRIEQLRDHATAYPDQRGIVMDRLAAIPLFGEVRRTWADDQIHDGALA